MAGMDDADRMSRPGLEGRVAAILGRFRYAVAMADQIALSVFNFALNLVLLRALPPPEYGIVSLWMAVSLLAIGVQGALVNTPFSVYIPVARSADDARGLEGALASVNLATIATSAAAVLLVGALVSADWSPDRPSTALLIALFVAANMYREFSRSIAFARRDMPMLALTDGAYLVVTAICLFPMLAWPDHVGGLAWVFLAMSLGCVAGQFCIGRRLARRPLRLFRPGWLRAYRRILHEVWWSLVSVLANQGQARGYVYVATWFAGIAALAGLSAVGVLFRPAVVLATAWSRSALPHLAALLGEGRADRFARTLWAALGVAAGGSMLLWLALWLAWAQIERHVLAGKYPDAAALLVPWAAASGISVLRFIAGTGLQAAREFRYLAHAHMLCGAISVAASAGMILWGGYTWTIWGMAIGEGVCLLMHMARLRRVVRRGAAPWSGGEDELVAAAAAESEA